MRIAFICYEFRSVGGINVYAHELVNRFVALGHDVTVFCPALTGRLAMHLDERIEIREIQNSPIPGASGPSFWVLLPFALKKVSNKDGPFDVVHANALSDVLLSKRWICAPRVLTVHLVGASVPVKGVGPTFRQLFARAEYGPARILEPVSLSRADFVIANSEHTKSELLRCYPRLQEDRIKVVYLGVTVPTPAKDPSTAASLRKKWNLKGRDKIILYVGRLEERKGLRFLFAALPKVPAGLRVVLIVIGPGDSRRFINLAKAMDISDRVVFAGQIPATELSSAYGFASALVQPSTAEGFGLSAAEAAAAGVPVVATRVGAVPEVIQDGTDGVLVDPGDTDALAKAITEVVSSNWRIGRPAGHQRTENLSWDRAAAETIRIYEDAIREAALRARRGRY